MQQFSKTRKLKRRKVEGPKPLRELTVGQIWSKCFVLKAVEGEPLHPTRHNALALPNPHDAPFLQFPYEEYSGPKGGFEKLNFKCYCELNDRAGRSDSILVDGTPGYLRVKERSIFWQKKAGEGESDHESPSQLKFVCDQHAQIWERRVQDRIILRIKTGEVFVDEDGAVYVDQQYHGLIFWNNTAGLQAIRHILEVRANLILRARDPNPAKQPLPVPLPEKIEDYPEINTVAELDYLFGSNVTKRRLVRGPARTQSATPPPNDQHSEDSSTQDTTSPMAPAAGPLSTPSSHVASPKLSAPAGGEVKASNLQPESCNMSTDAQEQATSEPVDQAIREEQGVADESRELDDQVAITEAKATSSTKDAGGDAPPTL